MKKVTLIIIGFFVALTTLVVVIHPKITANKVDSTKQAELKH